MPADIQDRRVEITGPVDRKMIINALNSGASVFMADFEDANTPKWDNNIQGQINLRDAIRRRIDYVSPEGKAYQLAREDRRAVRPPARLAPAREARAGSTARRSPAASSISRSTSSTTRRSCIARGSGPYFYLPKLESHLEARLWNDIFVMAAGRAAACRAARSRPPC